MKEIPKRLAPKAEVVRRLFLLSGNQCAYPGCTHPIILADGVYVGELCHIRAAEPGGERFDETQDNEARRAFENLLLLCHDHHVATNDVDAYPPDRMAEIKALHEARFQQGLASMMDAAGIQIIDSVVSLGGAGGAAPGAGGGGGGAIGPGARGGDGGQGGETRSAVFEVPVDLVELRLQVGEAGRGGTGERAAESGDDSVVEAVFADGSSVEVMRAKGGRAGATGEGRVRIERALLANWAEARGGLLFVMAGGWRTYTVVSLSQPVSFAVAFFAAPDQASRGVIEATLLDPQGAVAATTKLFFEMVGGEVPAAVQFFVALGQVGVWTVKLANSEHEVTIPFEVVLAAASAAEPASAVD